MSRTVYYDKSFTPSSSVISKVYYDSANRELFVHLHNGARVGYKAVPPTVYDEFSRASSAGNYWNTWIKDKPYYPGTNGDVNLVDYNATSKSSVTVNTPAPDPEFTVRVEVSGTITFAGTAKNGAEALRKVQEALDATFVGTSKVKELTQKFV